MRQSTGESLSNGPVIGGKRKTDQEIEVSTTEDVRDKPVALGPMLVKVDSFRDDRHINLTWRSWVVVL